MVTRRKIDLVMGASALLVVGLLTAIASGDMPLGVAGEWSWPRASGAWPSLSKVLMVAAALAAYGWLAAAGYRALGAAASPRREVAWVGGLTLAATALQGLLPFVAPAGFGPEKWGVIHVAPEATGYYKVARTEAADDPRGFFAAYPAWVADKGASHLGTHPPGPIAGFRVLLDLMERSPTTVRVLHATTPAEVDHGLRLLDAGPRGPIPPADRVAIWLTSLLTLLAAAGSTAPLYALARESTTPRAAWMAAAIWPLAPALNLFQPLPDTAYPLLSAAALALAAWSIRLKAGPWSTALAATAGVSMGVGMFFTLGFLAVGLIVALVVLTARDRPFRRRVATIVAIGVGFLAVVAMGWAAIGADPFAIWRANLANNDLFYRATNRSYRTWVVVNPIEAMIAAGLPAVVWGLVAAADAPRRIPRAAWCGLVVLAIVDISGRSRAEVARLWILLLPPLFTAVGVGPDRLDAGRQAVFVTIALSVLQLLGLQALMQFVFPP